MTGLIFAVYLIGLKILCSPPRPIPGNLLVVEVSGPSEAGKLEGAGRGWKGLEGAGRGWEGLEGGGKGWRPQLLSNHTIFPL